MAQTMQRQSLRERIAQRRLNMNATTDTLDDTVQPMDESLNDTRRSAMLAKRQRRQQILEESMRKPTESMKMEELDGGDSQDYDKSTSPIPMLSQGKSSAGLGQSIRDRLKDRVKRTQDETDTPKRRLAGLRGVEQQTRFDVENDEAEIPGEEDLGDRSRDHRGSSSLRWKILAKKGRISRESIEEVIDGYSFFTKTYDGVTRGGDGEKEGTATAHGSPDVDGSPEQQPFAQFDTVVVEGKCFIPEKRSRTMLTVPSSTTPPSQTFNDQEVYFIEEEGIYVGEPPKVPRRNWNRMENRLLKEERGKRWFGEDGDMIVAPDPLKQIPSRPLMSYSIDPKIQAFAKSVMASTTGKYIAGGTVHQLSISIGHMTFTHHPLFTREHVLVSRLTDLYQQYTFRQTHNLTEHLNDRMESLRQAINDLKETLGPEPWDVSKPFVQDAIENLQDYCQEIQNVRELNNIECFKDKQMIKSILTTWKEIKSVRETSGFVATSARLLVFRKEMDYDRDIRKWNQMIRQTLEEEKVGVLKEYRMKQHAYKNELTAYKMKMKNLEKKNKKKDGEGGESAVVPPKPTPPHKPSVAEIEAKIVEHAKKCHRIPGDPIIQVELTQSTPITPLEECPQEEVKRRSEVPKTCYSARLFYNNAEVTRISPTNMTSSFTVNFNETFCLQVVRWPESIKLEVWQGSEKVTDVYLGIPTTDRHTDNTELELFEFSSNQRTVHPGTTAVGSNVPSNGGEEKILLTTGRLTTGAAWVRTEEGRVLAPLRSDAFASFGRADPVQYIGAKYISDMTKVAEWIAAAKLDPNDPRNAPLLHLFNASAKDSALASKFFRLDILEQYTYFSSTEEMDNDPRYKLIRMRSEGIPEYKVMKMIPMHAKEVKNFQNQIEDETEEKQELQAEMNIFEQNRLAVSRYLQAIQEKIAARTRAIKPVYEVTDVVVEEQIPDIGTLGRSLAKLLEPRRPLRPQRKPRKKVTNQAIGVTNVDLLINISQAHSLPIRKQNAVSYYGIQSAAVSLRPYVEVSFQRNTRTTYVEDGPNPQWNQQVILPLAVPNNEYSSQNLRSVNDMVYFNVFDEIIVDILEDERLRETDVHHRRERRFLGTFKIPFSTIYINSRIEGKFRLKVPAVILGYRKDHDMRPQVVQEANPDMLMNVQGPADKNSYLSIFITVEPPLAPQPPLREVFDTTESNALIEMCALYEREYRIKFPDRGIRTLVSDDNGKSVFITRFISPQSPPAELIPESTVEYKSIPTLRKIAKFVSLIPYYQDSIVFAAKCDIWVTSELFLKMLAGDEEEHAVLLCNYFLFLGIDAYVVVGVGIPEGETCYVLTKIDGNNIFWNPATGNHYFQNGSYHSLTSVHFIFNACNIWANTQKYVEPDRISVNFNFTRHWKAFMKRPSDPLSTIQTATLTYGMTNTTVIAELQVDLEKTLTDKMMEWRERHVTRWNRHCRELVRSLLPKLEAGELTEEEQQNTLQSILESYHVTGFPLNLRYKDLKSIVEAVYSTNVHVSEDARAEFALAVYIHPYPNNVLSVWVYVVKLSRKQ